jgi:ElaB/YqjD/DUF883 family membrane-anchored ribosome-binding protein
MANANEPIETLFDRTEAELREQIEVARERMDQLDTQIRRAVQDRPLIAVGSALLLGYALGRLFSRR